MPIEIFGQVRTRTNRPLWMAAELELDFEVHPLTLLDSTIDSLNPNRKQPVIRDEDGTVVFESLAINLYLLRKYGGGSPIAPRKLFEEAKILQWTMWAATELDMRLFEAMMIEPSVPGRAGHPVANDASFFKYFGRERSAERRSRLLNELRWPMKVLEEELSQSPYLAGDRFTAADLNVSVVLGWARYLGEGFLASYPKVSQWLTLCFDRPHCPYNSNPPSWSKKVGVPGRTETFPWDTMGFDERYAKL